MRRVLHIGPCESNGGMKNVMLDLSNNPPTGFEASLLSSHNTGSMLKKWMAYRKAIKSLSGIIKDSESKPDVIHIHTAADWSWRRKKRFVIKARQADIATIVHIHSGKFNTWLDPSGSNSPSAKRAKNMNNFLSQHRVQTVVLSEEWKAILEPMIGDVEVISNPVNPNLKMDSTIERIEGKLLLLGRNDPVKNHAFAIEVATMARKVNPKITLSMSGIDNSEEDWINAMGWISEQEKIDNLHNSNILLVPSKWEGQPLVILEAMACGLAVIANSELAQLPDNIGKASLENKQQWVDYILETVESKSSNIDYSQQLVEYEIENVQQKWLQIYEQLIEKQI
jgi:glycosyltransferase involved in cell wall biosynthesis